MLMSAARTRPELRAMVDRRIAGEPLEHILGWAEFCGLRIAVEPGVFVPRRRTEFLVQQVAALARPTCVVVDLCCGSGAIGVALLQRMPDIELYATDITSAAVQCARRNLADRARVCQGDLYQALPSDLAGRTDLVVCNAPYVPTDAVEYMPSEARLHEPLPALDGGTDGLDVLRQVIVEATHWLTPGGHLLVEIGEDQSENVADVFSSSGLTIRVARSEELDATVAIGQALADES